MTRRCRLHVPSGVYYVSQLGTADHPIFSSLEDYTRLEKLLTLVLASSHCAPLSYCWTPQAMHLVLQIGDVPVGRIMQRVTCQYARKVNATRGGSGHFFRQRHRATLIDPENYLMRLIHYVHCAPVREGLADHPDDYAHTGHRIYCNTSARSWIHVNAVQRLLGYDTETQFREAYLEEMRAEQSPADIELFERGSRQDSRVAGGREFLRTLPRSQRTNTTTVTLDQVIKSVAHKLGLDTEQLMSASRKRELVLARALVTWYAIERRIATLSEVARKFSRDPSTMCVAVERHRSKRPDLFRLTEIHDLAPIVSLCSTSRVRASNGATPTYPYWTEERSDEGIFDTESEN